MDAMELVEIMAALGEGGICKAPDFDKFERGQMLLPETVGALRSLKGLSTRRGRLLPRGLLMSIRTTMPKLCGMDF